MSYSNEYGYISDGQGSNLQKLAPKASVLPNRLPPVIPLLVMGECHSNYDDDRDDVDGSSTSADRYTRISDSP